VNPEARAARPIRIRLGRLLALGLAVLIGADAALAWSDDWAWVAAGVALWGLHLGITQGLLATMVAGNVPADLRGTGYGFFNLVSGIAMLVASALAGLELREPFMDIAMIELAARNRLGARREIQGHKLSQALQRLAHSVRPNSRKGSRRNIAAHYDLGNAFYTSWLDDTVTYSSGLFPTEDTTLEEAQRNKMDHVCRKLRLRPGQRVFEAGCGWGGFALHMAREYGVEVALVIGGGNLFRGAGLARAGMDRVTGDQMGMLATVMNSLALQDALESIGVFVRVMSAIRINEVCEDYIRRRAVRHLEKGRVTIFAAGTGSPFFTTDSAASLRAIEIDADLLVKATKVDGVYDSDPMLNPAARRYDRLTYDEVLDRRLNVMDATAIVLCRDHDLPLRVINLNDPGALVRAAVGEDIGTLVTK